MTAIANLVMLIPIFGSVQDKIVHTAVNAYPYYYYFTGHIEEGGALSAVQNRLVQ